MAVSLKSIFPVFIFSLLNENSLALNKYNCDFLSENYDPVADHYGAPTIFAAHEPAPFWVENMIHFKTSINEALKNVISENLVSNVDEFSQFYRYQRTEYAKELSLKNVLMKYVPTYDPESSCYGLTMKVLDEVAKNIDNIHAHLFIVTAYRNMHKLYYSKLLKAPQIPNKWVHSYVAGAIRYNSTEGPGYVLIDASNRIAEAIILPDSEPGNIFPTSHVLYKRVFPTNPNNDEKYALCEDSRTRPNTNYAFYLTNPFCGFVKLLTKSTLLFDDKVIYKANAAGRILAKLDISLSRIQNRRMVFSTYDHAHGTLIAQLPINIDRMKNENEEYSSEFKIAAESFGMSYETLYAKIGPYREIIMDTGFLKIYNELRFSADTDIFI